MRYKHLTMCYKYYDNPKMLAAQYDQWANYPQDVKDYLDIVLVDDGSPRWPALDVPRPDELPRISIYRVTEDKPWNQNGATNLGAFVAEGPWLLITDMDHMVSTRLLQHIQKMDTRVPVFMFDRCEALTMQPTLDKRGNPKPHPNSYLITKKFYWEIGGHDEWYTGHYGTDRLLRQRIRARTTIAQLPLPLIRYSREIIDDASTTTLPRKENRNPQFLNKALAQKKRVMDEDKILTLQFPWEKVL